jgi:hypothetical protein
MKKLILAIIAGCILVAASGVALAGEAVMGVLPGHAFVPKGTLIDVEIASPVNSGDLSVNDIIYFKTVSPLSIDGVVIVPAGTAGEAVVTHVKHASFLGVSGGVTLKAKSLRTVNGAEIPLTLETKKYGGNNDLILAVILFRDHRTLSIFIQGADQVIPVGTRFQVAVDADADLGCRPALLPLVMIKNR